MTSDDILCAGLSYAGFDCARQAINNITRKINWFKAFYGVEPTTVASIFEDVRSVDGKHVILKELLMAFNWLFLYDTYPVLSGRWNFSEKYIMKTIIKYGFLIASLLRMKIIFDLEHDVKLGRTVDCCNFMIQEMRLDPSSKWYDHKSNSCGLVSGELQVFR